MWFVDMWMPYIIVALLTGHTAAGTGEFINTKRPPTVRVIECVWLASTSRRSSIYDYLPVPRRPVLRCRCLDITSAKVDIHVTDRCLKVYHIDYNG